MNTRKMKRLVARGSFCIYFDQRGPYNFPVFRSKHFTARRLRQEAKQRKSA